MSNQFFMPPAIAQLVSTFNGLPRREKAPSGFVNNDWHFEIRHVPIAPPGDLLFIINPPSRYVHCEKLPFPSGETDMETISLAVTIGLIKGFVSSLGANLYGNQVAPYAPWSWTVKTQDETLARAVERQLRKLGVRQDLVSVGVTGPSDVEIAEESWQGCYARLCAAVGV